MSYRLGVGDEPRNAASDLLRATWPTFSLEALTGEDWLEAFDDDFVREDRRKVVGLPPANAEEYVAAMAEYFSVDDGRAPEFFVDSIVAVRGNQLVLARLRIDFASGWSSDFLVVLQHDVTMGRMQKAVRFDLDDVEAAMTELDLLFAAIKAAER